MPRIDTQFFEHLQNIPVIDLHGLRLSDALEKMNQELYSLAVNKSPFCRIIHGVGGGILKEHVHAELEGNQLIEAFFLDSHGGSTTVRFYPHH